MPRKTHEQVQALIAKNPVRTLHLPTVAGPRDLPDLRKWLIDQFRPGTPLDQFMPDASWVQRALPAVSLWWVEPETCDLLAAAAPTIPADVTLSIDDLPTPAGFAIFAHDLEGIEAEPELAEAGLNVRVSGLMWAPINVVHPSSPGEVFTGLGIGTWSHSVCHDGMGADELRRAMPMMTAITARYESDPEWMFRSIILHGDLYSYLGRSDWLWDADVEALLPGDDAAAPVTLESKAEDRRLLAALWALTRTKITTVHEASIPRPVVRRSTRDGLDPTVRVLRLGGEKTVHGGDEPVSYVGAVEWKHSWIVSPHFRWQAHGPGRTERKLILIPAHRKGPDDKPLLGAERVWVVKPPKPLV